jgi:DNA-binding CsgD family transcriptional regulator
MEKQGAARNDINLDCLDEAKVVGYCQIGNDRYPIVEIENSLGTIASPIESSVNYKSINYLSVFEINGQNLAIIIETENLPNTSSDPTNFLTKREGEIATLVAKGNSNKQIANHLKISEWTVSTHLRRVFTKLGVDSRAAMVYRCADLWYRSIG